MSSHKGALEAARARVEALEAGSRRLRGQNRAVKGALLAALIGAVAWVVGGPAGGAQEKKKERVVEATTFILRDKAGKVRAGVAMGNYGPNFELYDEKENFRGGMLTGRATSPMVSFLNARGKATLLLASLPQGNLLAMYDNGVGRVGLAYEPVRGASLSLRDKANRPTTHLVADAAGAELAAFDAKANKRLVAALEPGAGRVKFLDAEGRLVAALPPAPKPGTTTADRHLALIPPDAVGFLTADNKKLQESKFGRQLRKSVGKVSIQNLELLKVLEPRVAEQLGEVQHVTVFWTQQGEPCSIWTYVKEHDPAAVRKKLQPLAEGRLFRGELYQVLRGGQSGMPAVYFLDGRTVVQGTPASLAQVLARLPAVRTSGPLEGPWGLVTGKAPVGGAAAPQGLFGPGGLPRPKLDKEVKNKNDARVLNDLLSAVWGAKTAAVRLDLEAGLTVHLDLAFSTKDEAGVALKAWRRLHTTFRQGLGMLPKQAGLERPEWRRVLALVRQVEKALPNTRIKQEGEVVRVSLPYPSEQLSEDFFDEVNGAILDLVKRVRAAAARMQSSNHLKQVAVAMHSYESTYGYLPPPHTVGKGGKPLLSWRVAILPYIEQDQLYKRFKHDEPWDSPHNIKLLPLMPTTYANPGLVGAKPGHTVYQAFVGPGAAFEPGRRLKFSDFADGTSNTLLVAEARDPVPWTKPEDLAFDPKKAPPAVGSLWDGIFMAMLADGSVHALSSKMPAKTLRALITRGGGEKVDPRRLPE